MKKAVCLSPNGVDQYVMDGQPDELLVATMDGVVKLTRDATGKWAKAGHALAGNHLSSLMIDAVHGAAFAGVHGGGLHRSRDGGTSWQVCENGLAERNVFSLGQDRRGDRITLYAGTEPAYLFKSTNGGDTWEEITALREVPGRDKWNFPAPPFIAHVKHVTKDPRDERIMYVCVEQGALLKSLDDGASFTELLFEDAQCRLNKDTHRIVFNPDDPDEIYVDGGDGVFRSRDAGAHWQRIADTSMRVGYPDQMFVPPGNTDTLFAVGGGTPPNIWRQTGNASSAVVRTSDGGRTWVALAGGLPESIPGNLEAATLVSWPGGYGFFAGSTDGEVYCSVDRGATWSLIASQLPPVSKCVHRRNLDIGRKAAAEAARQ
jgi:photosystem II stability/assembly factor-like uncharacterized protein